MFSSNPPPFTRGYDVCTFVPRKFLSQALASFVTGANIGERVFVSSILPPARAHPTSALEKSMYKRVPQTQSGWLETYDPRTRHLKPVSNPYKLTCWVMLTTSVNATWYNVVRSLHKLYVRANRMRVSILRLLQPSPDRFCYRLREYLATKPCFYIIMVYPCCDISPSLRVFWTNETRKKRSDRPR